MAKPKIPAIGRLVAVTWEDPYMDGDVGPRDLDTLGTALVTTYGELIKHDNKRGTITVAGEIVDAPDGSHYWRAPTTIVKSLIRKIKLHR